MRPLLLASAVFAACVTPRPSIAPAPVSPVPDAGTLDAGATPVVVEAPPAPPPPPDAGPVVTTAGQPITARKRWTAKLEGVGTSSPRLVELTGDGVLDVVLGGGLQGQRGWVYALDGKTGKLLWKARFKEEFYATPTLSDATRDGVPDVFIGGRDFDWAALDGKTGKKLWSLRAANPKADLPKRNFNGGLVVDDQDGDGVNDLLVSQGGSYDDDRRIPGRLFVISAASGRLLVNTTFPDRQETYAIPSLLSAHPLEVIAGTGGETLGGHLSRLSLSVDGGLAAWEVESKQQGFIASPLVTSSGGERVVFAAQHDGTMLRVGVDSGRVAWSTPMPGFESRPSPAPGRFGGKGPVDVVGMGSQGTFPIYESKNVVRWYDGETGAVLDEARSGVAANASPLVVDFDGDGLDETLTVSLDSFSHLEATVVSTATIWDGAKGKKKRLELKLNGAGSATPALGDLDGDGHLELVLTWFGVVECFTLDAGGALPAVRWGNFRGPAFDGVDRQGP